MVATISSLEKDRGYFFEVPPLSVSEIFKNYFNFFNKFHTIKKNTITTGDNELISLVHKSKLELKQLHSLQ